MTEVVSPRVHLDDGGSGGSYEMTWRHRLEVIGTLTPAGGSTSTRTTTFRSTAHTLGNAATNDDHYLWRTGTTATGKSEASRDDKARYHLVYRNDGWEVQDRDQTTVKEDGARHERLRDTMHSDTAAGTPSQRRSTERWSLVTDGPLGCGSTYLVGENPDLVKKRISNECPG